MPYTPTYEIPYELHDYQKIAVDRCLDEQKLLVASPTGTGKSFILLSALQKVQQTGWCLVPREEIIRDMLCKVHIKCPDGDMTDLMMKHKIITPIRFLNRVMAGEINPEGVTHVLKDEVHHDTAATYDKVDAILPDFCRQSGTTATPFRATAKQTAALHKKWNGNVHTCLSYPEAARRGFITIPECETWPLVDDDLLEVRGSDFEIHTLTAAVVDKLDDAITQSIKHDFWMKDGRPTQATIIGVPSSGLFDPVRRTCITHNLRVEFISQETPQKDRQRIFRGASRGDFALVHINVVSEGVDLPMRNYLDLCPTRSPNAFMQRFGRITRPTSRGGRYICTNRNLESHGYLLEGCLPPSVFSEAQAAFGKPSKRNISRVFGLESLGKIKPTYVKTISGVTLTFYCVSAGNGTGRTHYAIVLHPGFAGAAWFHREQVNVGESVDWGKWKHLATPPQKLVGYGSVPPNQLSERQKSWWDQAAKRQGIDVTEKVNAKQFQILPVLVEGGLRLE
jgi:superfamily II DNA or RNA helicase